MGLYSNVGTALPSAARFLPVQHEGPACTGWPFMLVVLRLLEGNINDFDGVLGNRARSSELYRGFDRLDELRFGD